MKIIFTGAGLSRNWGGFLAKDVAGLLVSHPNFTDRAEMRDWLLNKGNYEQAIAEMRRKKPEWDGVVGDALTDVFTKHDRLLRSSRAAVNNAQFLDFILKVLQNRDADPLFIFTTNQDLLLERTMDRAPHPDLPGSKPHPDWFKRSFGGFTDNHIVNVEDVPAAYPGRGFKYVKLHGSLGEHWNQGPSTCCSSGTRFPTLTSTTPFARRSTPIRGTSSSIPALWAIGRTR